MKKLAKILSTIGAISLAASIVPYYVRKDEETGTFEIGGLLWSLKKTPGEEKDNYTVELLPFKNGKAADGEEVPDAQEVIEEIADAAQDAGEKAADLAEELKETVEEKAEEAKEAVEETIEAIEEKLNPEA